MNLRSVVLVSLCGFFLVAAGLGGPGAASVSGSGFGSENGQASEEATFGFEYNGEEGRVVVTYEGGGNLTAGAVQIRGDGLQRVTWSALGSTDTLPEDRLAPGATAVLSARVVNWPSDVGTGDRVTVVSVSESGAVTTLATFTAGTTDATTGPTTQPTARDSDGGDAGEGGEGTEPDGGVVAGIERLVDGITPGPVTLAGVTVGADLTVPFATWGLLWIVLTPFAVANGDDDEEGVIGGMLLLTGALVAVLSVVHLTKLVYVVAFVAFVVFLLFLIVAIVVPVR